MSTNGVNGVAVNREAAPAVLAPLNTAVGKGAVVNGEAVSANAQKAWKVEEVAAEIPGGPPVLNSDSPIPFFHMLERLKTVKREGWRRFGIPHGESISDHMYRMALITMFAPPKLAAQLNIAHCTKMALVHDMAEALVGDITPVDGIDKTEKNRRESTTMDYFVKGLLGKVNGGMIGTEIKAVWQEYEDSKTLESKYVHDVDKVELLLQMVEYERVHKRELDLGEFSWVVTRIVLPEVQEWAHEILREREQFWGDKSHETYDDPKTPPPGVDLEKLEYFHGVKGVKEGHE